MRAATSKKLSTSAAIERRRDHKRAKGVGSGDFSWYTGKSQEERFGSMVVFCNKVSQRA